MDFRGMFHHLSALAADPALLTPFEDLALSEQTVHALQAKNVLDQLLFRFVADLDKRGVAKTCGAESTAELLQSSGLVAPAAAHRYVRVGRALSSLSSVSTYAVDGALSGEAMDAIVKGIGHIERRNPDLPEADRADCVRGLLTEALSAAPASVAARARAMAIALSPPDKEVPDAENDHLNELSFGNGDDGRTHGTLDLGNELGQKLAAALDPWTTPVPEPDGSPDPRTRGQLRAGVKPHVNLTMTAEHLINLQMSGITGSSTPTPAATFEWTGPVSAPTAQMIACDSVITKILVDDQGVPLDVGREHRTVTPAIRKALIARDRGCAFPGCGCPAGWTDGHHIKFWSHGGATSLMNTVLLCRRHHRYIHHKGWTVFIGGDEAQRSSTKLADNHPWFIKPGTTEHLRSHARRTLTLEPTAA